jgi:hypothetical protein
MNKRFTRTLLAAASLLLAAACSDNPTEAPGGHGGNTGSVSQADSVASYWLQALSDSLDALPDDGSRDDYRGIRYTRIRQGMDDAFAISSTSRVAHLGSALLDVIELNYSPELWAFIDSLGNYADEDPAPGLAAVQGLYLGSGSPILRNEFALLATAPCELLRWSMRGIPANLTIMRAQELLADPVIPALSSAIDHLGAAEGEEEVNILIQVEDEIHEIDLGEVYFFDAALHAARAGLGILTAYDLDLPGPDGTNGWIEEIRTLADQRNRWYGVTTPIPGTAYFRLTQINADYAEAEADSVVFTIVQHNYEERSGFLSLQGPQMEQAYADVRQVRAKTAAAVSSIRGETDPQENDVIRIADLVDLDSDIANAEERPNFAEGFTTIEDVLNWIETVLTGSYHISEDGQNGPIELDVNLSSLFMNAPSNWRDVLPYFEWTPAEDWVDRSYSQGPGIPVTPGQVICYDDIDGVRVCRSDIAEIVYRYETGSLGEVVKLLDPQGSPIDLGEAKVPYFPDYTFRGLFPSATRQTWLDLVEAAGW